MSENEGDTFNAVMVRWISGASGVFVLGCGAFGVAAKLLSGHEPPSWPWSSITLALLGANGIMNAAIGGRAEPAVRIARLSLAIFAAVGAVAWLGSAYLGFQK